ncbi:MAG TPA: serine protease [Labilithrix sp.]|jgi:S1-C subfamily serine protease
MRWIAVAVALVTAACGGAQVSPAKTLTHAEIAQRATGSIVRVESICDDGAAQATGFVVKDGLVATNLHVVARAMEITVVLPDHRRLPVHEVLLASDDRDLALLRIEAADLAPLPLADDHAARAGDHVTIGAAGDGRVSAVRDVKHTSMLQLSAPIARSADGAPIFDDHGHVVGVATPGSDVGMAIPASQIGELLGPRAASLSVAELHATALLSAPPSPVASTPKPPEPEVAPPKPEPVRTCDRGKTCKPATTTRAARKPKRT